MRIKPIHWRGKDGGCERRAFVTTMEAVTFVSPTWPVMSRALVLWANRKICSSCLLPDFFLYLEKNPYCSHPVHWHTLVGFFFVVCNSVLFCTLVRITLGQLVLAPLYNYSWNVYYRLSYVKKKSLINYSLRRNVTAMTIISTLCQILHQWE